MHKYKVVLLVRIQLSVLFYTRLYTMKINRHLQYGIYCK